MTSNSHDPSSYRVTFAFYVATILLAIVTWHLHRSREKTRQRIFEAVYQINENYNQSFYSIAKEDKPTQSGEISCPPYSPTSSSASMYADFIGSPTSNTVHPFRNLPILSVRQRHI
eukprot:TRINITY_DN5908_c0_g1_i5.p1 TRINITY_DN5908_c0_g1~~TRINITY_DN5908_c0_g1_i5.p1  ORF type:complete len:116 (-),score=6.47 TRINITY_DN5908_c0_g1_i5:19-366(-)